MIENKDIYQKLQERIGRLPKQSEIENAHNDVGLLVPLILDELRRLHRRVTVLEQK